LFVGMDKNIIPSTIWQGVVLAESLEDTSLLKMAKIVGTKISKLEKENRVMTFHNVEVRDAVLEKYVEKAKSTIKQGFYTHLCNPVRLRSGLNAQMIVIFRNKIFRFGADDPQLIEAREYGKKIGIIPEQMDFEKLIDNPFD
jgi:hypothetical protein